MATEAGIVTDTTKANIENSLGSVDGGMPEYGTINPDTGVAYTQEELDAAAAEVKAQEDKVAADAAEAARVAALSPEALAAEQAAKVEADKKTADDAETARLAALTPEERAAEEAAKGGGKGTKTDAEKEELLTLRQITREQKRQMDALAEKLEATNKKLQESGIISAEDIEAQKAQDKLLTQRQEGLDMLLEVMRVNPTYQDVDTVVSEQHFDEMIEAMAKVIVNKEGGDLGTVEKSLRDEVWSLKNPYKFMYENIKAYHPEYQQLKKPDGGADNGAGKTEAEKAAAKVLADKTEADKLAATKIASSIHDGPGGGDTGGTWTKAAIDALSEEELDKVPPAIYQSYLRNQLA